MPIYQYLIVNSKSGKEILEIEQGLRAQALTNHPITGEPIRRIIQKSKLTLSHSTTNENKSLELSNLEKKGFTVFEKDNLNPAKFIRKAGKLGPNQICID